MAELEWPNGALPVGIEVAFGAEVNANSEQIWEWTDLTPVLMDQTINITRGRQNEAADVDPTSSGVILDNPTGDLTPYNAMSPYWPHVDLGTPARLWLETPSPRLFVPPTLAARAEVASTGALDITSDMEIIVDLHARTTDPDSPDEDIAGRLTPPGSFSWQLKMLPDRRVVLQWSTTGTGPDVEAVSTVPVLPGSARIVLRVTLDVDNGAGGWDVIFSTGPTMLGPWTQIGPAVTGVGVTSVFNTTDPLVVGSPPPGSALDMDVYGFQLLQGIGGAPIADADFTAQTSGVPSFVDAAGLTWTMHDEAAVTDRWYRAVGTVDKWAPMWPYGDLSAQQDGGLGEGEARVGITISGILRRLGQRDAPLNSALRRSIEDEPTMRAYWPLEDERDSTQIASAVPGGEPMPVGGAITFANSDDLVGSKALPTFSESTFFSGPVTGTFDDHWQVDWYTKVPFSSMAAGTWSLRRVTSTGTVRSWEVRINSSLIAVFGFDAAGTTVTSASIAPTDFFDRMVHIRLYAVQSGPNVTWTLKWGAVTYPPTPDISLTSAFVGTVGAPTGVALTPGAGMKDVISGHLAVFDAADLDTTGPAAMGWVGETAMDRIARLCREQGVLVRVIGSSEETERMGPQPVGTFLGLIDQGKEADGGILYELPYLVGLVYRSRASLYNQPVNLVLDGLEEQFQNPLEPVRDDQRIRNYISVTREGGSSATDEDEASIRKHGIYDDAVTLNLFSDAQTVGVAAWRLHQGTLPGMRYEQVTMHIGAAPEILGPWLTVDSGSRIRLVSLPPQHPTDTVEVMAEGYSEEMSPEVLNPVVNASAAAVWDVAVIDGEGVADEYLFRPDTDGSELNVGVNSTATALDVEVTAGPFWVESATEPLEFPFDIRVGGERMRVTAISAPVGSVQQFTVVRSVNGVVKAHSAGTEVELWFQPVLAR